MSKPSAFVFDKNFPAITGSAPDTTTAQADTTLDKIINTAGDVGNVLTEVDKVLNPSKYNTPPREEQQYQPQTHAGFGWTKWLLIAGVVSTAGYYGKKALSTKKNGK